MYNNVCMYNKMYVNAREELQFEKKIHDKVYSRQLLPKFCPFKTCSVDVRQKKLIINFFKKIYKKQ